MADRQPIGGQGVEGRSADRNFPLFPAFPKDPHETGVEVQLLESERAKFTDPQAGSVKQFEDGEVSNEGEFFCSARWRVEG